VNRPIAALLVIAIVGITIQSIRTAIRDLHAQQGRDEDEPTPAGAASQEDK
jgi:hypothetical protein